MDVLTLIDEARQAGLSLFAAGDRLEIRGPREAKPVAEKLGANKEAVLAELKRETTATIVSHSSVPAHGDPWELPGYHPGRRIIRDGIEHKRQDCNGRRGWRHVWGGRFCCDCWPCTDLAAMVPEGANQ